MRNWVILILLAIICGLGVGAFFLFYEEHEEQVWIGASQEARRNPFLAAQRFLDEKGVEVFEESTKLNFDELPSGDMVFLSEVDSILVSKSQIDAAMAWIERGGFLIVGVGKELQGYDSLLSRFDIKPAKEKFNVAEVLLGGKDAAEMSPSERMREINRKIKERNEKEKASEQSGKPKVDEDDSFNEQLFDLLNIDDDHKYYKVNLGEDVGDIYLAVLDRVLLEHPLVYADDEEPNEYADGDYETAYEMLTSLSDETGPRLLQFRHGEGTFTAISSSELWDNDYIGLADHAFFLSYFVPEGSRLHFFYNFDVPSLWEMLKKYFLELILISMLMLVLWLWRRGLRVQREVEVTEGQRRSFAEHLHAAAKFLVVNKQYSPLINSIKEDIELQMRPFYPGFSQLNSQSQAAMLVERTELSEDLINSWTRYCENVKSQDELLAALKIGNAIRKKL